MQKIPLHLLEKGYLIPLEEFLYEKYKLQLDNICGPDDFSPSMKELAKKYPDAAENFCNICTAGLNPNSTEQRYLDDAFDIALTSNLRYMYKPPHSHQFFEIIFVLEGTCENYIHQNRITLQKGDLCFIAPDITHQLFANSHETIAYNILVRSSTFHRAFTNIYGNHDIISDFFTRNIYQHNDSSPYILCKTDCESIYKTIMNDMISEKLNPGKFSERYINNLFDLFIIKLLRNHEYHFTIGQSTENVEFESITAILRYIQGNYSHLTLPDTARFFNYSEAHLSRMIKQATGQNFSEIVKTIKLQKATQLLLKTELSITEIVEEIGYTDNSHFYKIFKKNYGLTPIQYKEKHQND